jgi:hypothetical protein
MSKFRFRSFLDDAVFVVLIMAGAVISAAMEAGAILGAVPKEPASALAAAEPSRAVAQPVALASAPSQRMAGDAIVAGLAR